MADSLWEKLNQEATLANLQRLFRSNPRAGASAGGPAVDIEQLIEDARREAERRDLSLGQVLRERGFDIPDLDPPDAQTDPRAAREELMRAIEWEPRADPDDPASAPEPELDLEQVPLDLPGGMFQDIERLRILRALGDPALVARLAALGWIDEAVAAELHRVAAGSALAARMLTLDVPRARLLDVADCEPWVLPHGTASEWLDNLLEQELVSWKVFRAAQQRASEGDGRLLRALLAQEEMTEEALLAWFEGRSGVPVGTDRATIPRAVVEAALPWVRAFEIVPVAETKKEVRVAAAFVLPPPLIEALEGVFEGLRVRPVLMGEERVSQIREAWLQTAIERFDAAPPVEEPVSTSGAHFTTLARRGPARLPSAQEELLARAVSSRSAVEVVRVLLEVAMTARATDIHLEPGVSDSRIRFRVDGVCMEVVRLSKELFLEVAARIKVLADLDVTERRRPQDGAIRFSTSGRAVDLRIASVPTRLGEKLAVRIADSGNLGLELSELGLRDEDLVRLRSVTQRPHGLILATGPVGSGKTTTLYGCLSEVDRTALQVVSIEDPVEIELEGANQVEVNRLTGVDFVHGLRALLRQDPDVLLIGEIRDVETAQIGVRAAMTGRMVYSTLHANSAAEAITTLRNFGIQDFVVSAALQGVIAQRLMRRVCDACAEPATLDANELAELGLDALPATFTPRRGRGCEACSGSGYRGRVGIFEVLTVDDAMRDRIATGAAAREIESHALAEGMTSLHDAAVDAIGRGLTTPEERRRVLGTQAR